MSSDKTALGDRMKRYEASTRFILPPRTHTILRVDGRAFHTLLKDAEKPFDREFMDVMGEVMQFLCAKVTGTVFAYSQSDEISLLLEDFKRHETEPWFGGVVQKMVSTAASDATRVFDRAWKRKGEPGFDARVYTIPDPSEVANYFLWRQRDAERNSVSMVAESLFTSRELFGIDTVERQDMMRTRHGVDWNDYPERCKRGTVCVRETYAEDVVYEDKHTHEVVTVAAQRSRWVLEDAPYFTADPLDWLAQTIVVDRES